MLLAGIRSLAGWTSSSCPMFRRASRYASPGRLLPGLLCRQPAQALSLLLHRSSVCSLSGSPAPRA